MKTIKTLYFFIAARIQGQPLTWVGAKFKAASVDEEQAICEKADDLILRGVSAVSGFKIAQRHIARKAIEEPTNKVVHIASKYFLGRLFICALNGSMNPRYLFNGI